MKDQKVGIIVQARMGSSRLPGKVLKTLSQEETVLDVLIKRLKLSKRVDEIIIATTKKKGDSLIIDVAKSHNVSFFLGSENNVLERHYQAAEKFNLDIIIRITSDCPFVDPKVLDDMIIFYLDNEYEFIRNRNLENTTNFAHGFDTEIFSFVILKKIYLKATTDMEKEHVTYYVTIHLDEFNMFYYNLEDLKKFDDLRLTIDYKEDFIFCKEIYKKLIEKGKPINFSVYDILDIIEENQELMNINKKYNK